MTSRTFLFDRFFGVDAHVHQKTFFFLIKIFRLPSLAHSILSGMKFSCAHESLICIENSPLLVTCIWFLPSHMDSPVFTKVSCTAEFLPILHIYRVLLEYKFVQVYEGMNND